MLTLPENQGKFGYVKTAEIIDQNSHKRRALSSYSAVVKNYVVVFYVNSGQ